MKPVALDVKNSFLVFLSNAESSYFQGMLLAAMFPFLALHTAILEAEVLRGVMLEGHHLPQLFGQASLADQRLRTNGFKIFSS